MSRALASPSGQQEQALFELVKESGEWRISSIQIEGTELSLGRVQETRGLLAA